MFAIIISEKGGAERRESYDKSEISVGRVQGNDLMLPKGNVSKRHARLLYRDGRFIVTDLKSTNGTYVNGRKITQATIVREGDKIYIGDFVLRLESAFGGAGGVLRGDSGAFPQPGSADRAPVAVTPRVDSGRSDSGRVESTGASRSALEIGSQYSVDEGGEEGPPSALNLPSPPRLEPQVPPPPAVPGASGLSPFGSGRGQRASGSLATPATFPPGGLDAPALRPTLTSARSERPRPEASRAHAHRLALSTLLDAMSHALDLAPLDHGAPADAALVARIERALVERTAVMAAEGQIPAETSVDTLRDEARRELLELGPLQALLDDEDVDEIHVVRHDIILAMRGREQAQAELAFSSETALQRVVARLCVSSGKPLGDGESIVERRLPSGTQLVAALPPAISHGRVLALRKRQRADLGLDDLVRSGTISRAMAVLMGHCVAGRANVLVVGPIGAGTTSMLGALVAAGATYDRVVVLQEIDEIVLVQPHAVSMLLGDAAEERARIVRLAGRLRPDHLVVGSLTGHVALEVMEAIGDGVSGVLAATRAPSLRHALGRLAAELAARRPGLGLEAAREWLAASIDVAIEVARLRDGRHRVLRLAELGLEAGAVTPRDIFTFVVERTAAGGEVEGAFQATGRIPRFVEELNGRGAGIDTSIFRRPTPPRV